ncbi:hypothetical protein [Fretibacter rubidus]|uniref:hypothetical protein n=1 Tax=Fretibacter rubidus TaxID=570162 RepID=UPI00352A4AC6
MTFKSNTIATALTAGFLLSAGSAFAADTQGFTAATAADPKIRTAASEFKRGDFAKSIAFSKAALNSKMKKSKQAVAQSNLCAAYGAMGELDLAKAACDAALSIRPNYAPAMTNRAALAVRFAATAPTTQGGGQ